LIALNYAQALIRIDYANVEGALIQDAVASVNSDGVTQDSFSTDSSLVYRLEKGRLSLDADTSDTVSSNGILLATRRISLAYQQQFSARLSGDIGIAWRDFKQVDEAGDAFAQNEQVRGSLTLRYQLSPEWRLRTTVSTAYRQREGLDEVDDRQAIKLDIAWQPRAWSIAR